MHLTKSEREIMAILWEAGRPLSRNEIVESNKEKSWKASSIHILLNSMLEKQAIQVAGFQKMNGHYGRTFAPVMTEPEYAVEQIQSMACYRRSPDEAVKAVVGALLDGAQMDDKSLGEMERMLREKRKKKS